MTKRYLTVAITMLIMVMLLLGFSQRYQISITQSATACLPITAAMIDTRNHSPKRGHLMSFLIRKAEPYFAEGTNFVKIAAGIAGDTVTIDEDGVTVTSPEGEVIRYDTSATRMLAYTKLSESDIKREFVVPEGQYFALGTLPASFDSRYWGLVKQSDVIGVGYAIL
ncbi:S26 family signal peptidase [Vibrio sp. SCSIO 43140]|uniref:S26 family signal peptidase n=1 Tax=Vibrio sp. SCSIO 43140 TaxID=2819100 RepID=UPI00207565ED|nr:S26 family signal peptidase [Vibrio sp. SCSIO 43140]USD58848.1 S26 family signal peptidase [Vibrio sp. SCSIO 43140]